jgi:hypothetical protein
VAVSLPADQQRALSQIEQALLSDDPRLWSLFAVFTRLTRHEAMPGTEQVKAPLRQLLQPVVVIPVTLITLAFVLLLSVLIPGGRVCGSASAAAGHSDTAPATAHCRSGPAVSPGQQYFR